MTATREQAQAPVAPPPAPPRRLLVAGLVAVLLVGIVLRLISTGPLWLDESLSAEIARRPLGAMFTALRHDGSPPLYYLLLHLWIKVFGTSTIAVRSLSSVFAVLGLPLAYLAGRQLGGRRLGIATMVVVAMSPWNFRYATETRMYMLLFDFVLVGITVLARALERPTTGRLVAVGLTTLAIAYTHYWGLYLIAPVVLALLVRRRWRILAAMAISAIGYLPWLPSLLYQLKYTGTPWAQSPSLSIFTDTVVGWGGTGQTAALLGVGLLLVAVCGIAFAVRPPAVDGRWLAATAAAPLVVAVVLGEITHAGYTIRYTAVALPAYCVLVGLGLLRLPRRGQVVATALLVVLGVVGGLATDTASRTQAGAVARQLARQAQPGDVVGYCPDQLSPAVHRMLPADSGLHEIAYADPTEGPALVDWVHYAQHVADVTPQEFANQLLNAAGPGHAVWLVSSTGYRLFSGTCQQVAADLAAARGPGSTYVSVHAGAYERESLVAFPVVRR